MEVMISEIALFPHPRLDPFVYLAGKLLQLLLTLLNLLPHLFFFADHLLPICYKLLQQLIVLFCLVLLCHLNIDSK